MAEKYTPSQEEIIQAEETMTPEQKEASEIREKFMFQERDPFDDFLEQIEKNDERREPTPEEKIEMDNRLKELGRIFSNSDIKWQLDGAMNISLMKGEYIGIHKDTDISIEQDELEQVDEQLGRNGYGLFLSYEKEPGGKKIMERVGPRKFSDQELGHLVIAAVNKDGQINDGGPLDIIDVHLVRRDEENKPVGSSDVELPEKWFEPQTINFEGQEINLSHPAKVAYYKLHGERSYDTTDLKKLAELNRLTVEDIDEIEQIFDKEGLSRRTEAATIVGRVADTLSPDMSADQIFEKFAEEPRIAAALDEVREQLKVLCEKIEASDKSKDEVIRLTFEVFNLETDSKERRRKLVDLKNWVVDANKLKEIHGSLGLE